MTCAPEKDNHNTALVASVSGLSVCQRESRSPVAAQSLSCLCFLLVTQRVASQSFSFMCMSFVTERQSQHSRCSVYCCLSHRESHHSRCTQKPRISSLQYQIHDSSTSAVAKFFSFFMRVMESPAMRVAPMPLRCQRPLRKSRRL